MQYVFLIRSSAGGKKYVTRRHSTLIGRRFRRARQDCVAVVNARRDVYITPDYGITYLFHDRPTWAYDQCNKLFALGHSSVE